jgi:hypothetical protein
MPSQFKHKGHARRLISEAFDSSEKFEYSKLSKLYLVTDVTGNECCEVDAAVTIDSKSQIARCDNGGKTNQLHGHPKQLHRIINEN